MSLKIVSEKPFEDNSIKVFFLLLLDACIEITVMKEKKASAAVC